MVTASGNGRERENHESIDELGAKSLERTHPKHSMPKGQVNTEKTRNSRMNRLLRGAQSGVLRVPGDWRTAGIRRRLLERLHVICNVAS
jgi:hypothetical protein